MQIIAVVAWAVATAKLNNGFCWNRLGIESNCQHAVDFCRINTLKHPEKSHIRKIDRHQS